MKHTYTKEVPATLEESISDEVMFKIMAATLIDKTPFEELQKLFLFEKKDLLTTEELGPRSEYKVTLITSKRK